jgi:hypothetical protein
MRIPDIQGMAALINRLVYYGLSTGEQTGDSAFPHPVATCTCIVFKKNGDDCSVGVSEK